MFLQLKTNLDKINKYFNRFNKFNIFAGIFGLYIFSFLIFYILIFKKYNSLILGFVGWLMGIYLILRYFGGFYLNEKRRNNSLSNTIQQAKSKI